MRIKLSIPYGEPPVHTEIELEGENIFDIQALIKEIENIKGLM
jgi:hypothetical protein